MQKRKIRFITILLLFLAFTLKTTYATKRTPMSCKAELKNIVNSNNSFALKLYTEISTKRKENVFISPFNVTQALALAFAGARGKTESEMLTALNFYLPQKNFHRDLSCLIRTLKKANRDSSTLRIATALWLQRNFEILKTYASLVENFYGNILFQVDFSSSPEKAREMINKWVEKQTAGKIKELLTKGDVSYLTRLIITTAIYFRGLWKLKFDRNNTKEDKFFIAAEKTIRVPMMYQKNKFGYFENKKVQCLELPYSGDELSMIILLPRQINGILSIEKDLSLDSLNKWIVNIHKRKVKVYIPRFEMEERYELVPVLSDMGMITAFKKEADFSGITGKRDLYISNVIHQAFIKVDEEGTEATAATGVSFKATSMVPGKIPVFKADHPFIFFILHRKTGAILFIGRIHSPL